ncbi:LysR family transcriptional regulator [Nocardiopsis sp. Huas11]|uniref:LysR family transcriptional regulator n=1 Tax=Nocardiopsis sp. Huas11 TaxID=2183912 RepID=UPI000EB01474|nr:LysR family transcriptional regulator [Nocardiopsis sp. Huas11]
MELRQLAYFTAVADEGGFARAAAALHVGQPAVSQQVGRLERELGLRLFDRSTRHVRLTAAGERLLGEARAVLAAAERMRRVAADLASAGAGTRTLHLGTGQAPDAHLYPVLAALAARPEAPRVAITKAQLAERLEGVRSGGMDAALVRDLEDEPGLELLPAWSDPLIAAIPSDHPLADGDTLSLRLLGDLPVRLAEHRHNPPFRRLVARAFLQAGIDPPEGPPFTRLQETLADMAHAPPSWTLFYPVGPPPPLPGIVYRPLEEVRSRVRLAVPPGPPSPAVRHLLAVLPGDPDG